MRIWDTFLFYNELDMLECRLTELENTPIHKHVIVESAYTFQGNRKPLYYMENQDRFAKWKDRIVHVAMTDAFDTDDHWEREVGQRELIGVGLQAWQADPDDIVLLSDVDEIPRPELINERMYTSVVYTMRQHMFSVNWLHPDPWAGTVVQNYGLIDGFQNLRNIRESPWPRVPDAGWHLTYLGGDDAVRNKVAAYAHPEIAKPMENWLTDGRIRSGLAIPANANGMVVPFNDGVPDMDSTLCKQQTYMEVDDSYPRWIREGKCPGSWFHEKEVSEEEISEKE